MERVACPTTSQLVLLLRGEIADELAVELAQHIDGCPRCTQSLELLAGSASAVSNWGRGDVQRASAGGTTPTIAQPALSEPQSDRLSFLTPADGLDEIGWLAQYRIFKMLGEGGMGIVLLAEDTQLQRLVALKVIKPEFGQDFVTRQRFLNEARAMAQVRSDHVVTIYQVGQANDTCYIAMELLEGEPLDRWLDPLNLPPLSETVRIGREIAVALAAAHARGLIHRDIKPANVWLESPSRRVKLLDFGLARPQAADVRLTRTGIVVGTPAYLSPEQARAQTMDGRSDLFSLGSVLYQMTTGRLPFQGETTMAVLTALASDMPPPPSHFNPAMPATLIDLIMRLLAKRPADRPDSAEAVVTLLQAIEQTGPLPGALPLAQSFADALVGDAASMVNTAFSLGQLTPPSGQVFGGSSSAPSGSDERSAALETRPSKRRIREAERRQVTVLVCGCALFESEAYLENFDAEDQAKVLRGFEQACEQAVRRFDGTVVQCNEQGLLVCFGYPVAYEDGPRRAARTGLDILSEMKALADQLRREHKLELNPWVGLHTGSAVVEAKEDTVSLVGDARNVAVRLVDVAAPGQILCSEATYRLIRGQFRCSSLGARKVKGVAQPVELYEVLGVGDSRGAIEAVAPAGLTPLTGRDHEVNLLKERWEQAQEGMGQIVLLIREPGLGKSRLVYALKEHVLGQMVEGDVDAPVIEWRCSPQFQNTGLYPAINFYEGALAFDPKEAPLARFERLLHRLEQYDLARPETVPLWASLLSLPTTDRFAPLSLSPTRLREETFRAILEWLHTRAARRPVLFIVEDLHWVDASTLEFLGQFLGEGLHDSILTLLTFRPEFKTPWPAVAHQTSLALTRLTRRQVGDLIRKKTGGAVPEALVERIYERAGGVPLFAEEFTKMVQESGVLEQAGDGGARGQTLLGHEIPATLQDLVMARLDRLEGDREVAQLAATLGREFSYDLLAAATTWDEPTLQAEVAKLVQAEILYQKGRPPRCTYIFKHALLEDALYNALIKAKRQQFHRRIAEVLETRFPQTAETQPELLALHFTEAGAPEKAIGYWLKAGLRSRERSAEIEAISHLTRGLELLKTLDESPERDARELELLSPLGTAYIASRGYAAPEVGPVFRRARELCERVGQPSQLFALMLGIWEWHTVRGDLRLCAELAAEAMEFAGRLNDSGILMEALFMSGETMLYCADFVGARDCFAKAVGEYDDRERTKFWAAHTSHNAGVTCRSNLAVSLWHLGYADQALRTNREMRHLAREIGHPYSLAYSLHHTAWLYQYCRLGAEVLAAAEEEIAIATEQGFALWHATGTFFKGAGMLLQGKTEKALPLLLKGIEAFRAGGAELTLPFQLSILGEAYTQDGQFKDARQALDEGLAIAEKNDDRVREAELHRLKGELLLAESPDQAAAEDCFRNAVETARRQRSKAWELRASMSLARLRQQQGRRDEAREALASVYNTYTEGFTTPDLLDARALLEALA